MQGIASFAMYGFPESHAASFALIAYASAYLKVHYLAAFTCAMLNNQPMGFYSPAVLVKDAQRHGLRVRPIDVLRSAGSARLKYERMALSRCASGFNYAKGLRQSSASAVAGRALQDGAFQSVDDLAAARSRAQPQGTCSRWLALARSTHLAEVEHRRDALWQVEQAARPVGPLLRRLQACGEDLQNISTAHHDHRRAHRCRLLRHRANHGPAPNGLSSR